MCEYYEINAKRYAAETFSSDMSEQYQRFLPLLRKKARILDAGSGSGRDSCYFQKRGYEVTALEPSRNLCKEIEKVFSGEIVCSDIQAYQPDKQFDGIWACASFHHLQEKEVLGFFEKIDRYLNENGDCIPFREKRNFYRESGRWPVFSGVYRRTGGKDTCG